MSKKQQIVDALYAFINQRGGLEFGNYGNVQAFRSEQRSITKDGKEARQLVRDIERRNSITADDIVAASKSAFSGRLTIDVTGDKVRIDYCTGQYFPTEYRKAVAAVAAATLWAWTRDKAMPESTLHHNSETGETLHRIAARHFA